MKIVYLVLSVNKLLRLTRAYTSFKNTNNLLPYIGSFATLIPWFVILIFVVHIFAVVLHIMQQYEKSNDCWSQTFKDQNYSSVMIYIVAIYFVLTTVSTVGYGDIYPRTSPEVVTMIFIEVIGVIMHTLLIARMITVFFNTAEQSFMLQYKVTQDYMKFKHVSEERRREVRNFCQYYMESTGATGGVRNLLKNIPKSLRTTIKLELTRGFFESTVSFSALSPSQLSRVANIIKHITFSPGSYLCKQGEQCHFLLFPGRGLISIIVDNQVIATESCNSRTVHCESQMLLGSQCATSIRALTYVDAWVLYKDDLTNLMLHSGFIRSLMMQSIAAAFPVMIEDIAHHMLGDSAPIMLKKLRKEEPIDLFQKSSPRTMRLSQSIPMKLSMLAGNSSSESKSEEDDQIMSSIGSDEVVPL